MVYNLKDYTMSTLSSPSPSPITASGLHLQAATDHEMAAKHHKSAMDSHIKNNLSDAKDSSKKAMGACNSVQKKSEPDCGSTAK